MRRLALALALVGSVPAMARAESGERFFVEQDADEDATAIDGSLTSTTFYYTESGLLSAPLIAGNTATRTASPVGRLFTDLRAQLDARHIGGGRFNLHADLRGRVIKSHTNPDSADPATADELPTQSGTLSGDELEARELYVHRDGKEYDVFVGRKISLELAAVKFDGVEIQRRVSKQWTYLGFVGLYPTRGSRDVRDDYPKDLADPTDLASGEKRIMPVTGGLGGAYRYDRYYGALGAVVIAPLARDLATNGQLEKPRLFATASGYFRKSASLDLFHYLVVDAMGASGAGLTNLTLGLGFQPLPTVRLTAQITRVDTETLNVQAQTQLDDPDPDDVGLQNNIAVRRVAQESARAGLSVAFKQNRFELSTHGTVRRRPELTLATSADGMTTVVFPTAQAADVFLGFVDRRSWKDLRIAASVVRSFGIGGTSLNRSTSTVARLGASRELKGGRMEVEGDLSFVAVKDDNLGVVCDAANLETCYGSSKVTSLALGGLAYYRFKPQWFLIGSLNLGRLSQTATQAADVETALPAITTASVLVRVAFRF